MTDITAINAIDASEQNNESNIKDENEMLFSNLLVERSSDTESVHEHPKSKEIQRQVDYYFSDENLATDEHLRTLMCGASNLPVSLGQLLGWKRMRQYKPKAQVIEALRKCANVRVIDNKRIQRIKPYLPESKEEHMADIATIPGTGTKVSASDGIKSGYEIRNGVVARAEPKASKRTGFEEGYTEGPLRPEVHEAEEEMYYTDVPVSSRIELGIYRFVSRRKFDNLLRHNFDRFLRFGGIDISPPNFCGKKDELKDADAHYQAQMLGHHSTPKDAHNPSKYEVDFLGIAQCYLGGYVVSDLDAVEANATCKVMVNFYNYLLAHNVCIEHNSQIMAAKELVTHAQLVELPLARKILTDLPGAFNKACSLLFSSHGPRGQHSTHVTFDDPWASGEDTSLDIEQARLDFLYAALSLGSSALAEFLEGVRNTANWYQHVESCLYTGVMLEILSVQAVSSDEIKDIGRIDTADCKNRTAGIVSCRPWNPDLFDYFDLPNGVHPTNGQSLANSNVCFWMEESMLACMKKGMKIQCQIRLVQFTANERLWVLESVSRVYCSFYQPTLNELLRSGKPKMVRWRVQRPDYIVDQFGNDGHLDLVL